MKKRIISLLLCLVLIVSLMPAAAAASTSDSKTVTVRYASGHGVNTHDYAAAFTYSDELFTKSGYTYRQDLAEMSLGLAFAAFSSKDSEYEDQLATSNRNFISFAEQCGFENIRSNKWMTQPAETDSIGINCASKTIRDNGGQYTLIAVGVRGNNYHAEWGGNARLGASGEHAGFAMGRDQVLDYLRAIHCRDRHHRPREALDQRLQPQRVRGQHGRRYARRRLQPRRARQSQPARPVLLLLRAAHGRNQGRSAGACI